MTKEQFFDIPNEQQMLFYKYRFDMLRDLMKRTRKEIEDIFSDKRSKSKKYAEEMSYRQGCLDMVDTFSKYLNSTDFN